MTDRRVVWTRFAFVALALALTAVVLAAQCWLPQVSRQVAHPDHPLVTSLGGEFVVSVDHAHLFDHSSPPCPEQFATAILPRSAIPSFASVAVVTVAPAVGLFAHVVVAAGRGPPTAPVHVPTGQELLTRFCLARR
ncbi:hypothetical protein MB901379_04179 [Mycobacterium basiliense]|uniref:Lipoprotein LpqS n=1 Tax=Mycobacterium basiliense TaxID=2094119 RepID=A0A447GJ88_9MYCO|nr:hypothetical protein [Mycobacterium basiliense]VDM90577.1 hypothetical protein MB901379_04179 [Mycobacterium basiliense]